ncbi:hypothetical protein N7468_002420 [Penicillium chermesinum]|uniref:Ankyrin n=1 Tax=Penicillium chermesinum TaxID=63820 RepID=A0A9W9PLD6_9EURO|nr:uncharacterized protein N7468_002420 [Penicillium chermesinum]KAJ5247437.1 hypothetical protein N7468_002420 [Penicillium chermesinum]
MIHIDNEHPPPEQQPKRRRMMPDHANKRFSSPAAISFVPHMGLPIPMSTPDLSLSARAHLHTFETACREGNLPAVMAVTLSDARTPELLHHGLMLALAAGHVEITHHLLANGAFIDRRTPVQILSAPEAVQVPLFDLLAQHGWTPGELGAVLLPRVVTNLPLLNWFLLHGVDPNLGTAAGDVANDPNPRSCAALEAASARGEVEAVRLLLDAGAEIHYGTPLHFAAGACSPGISPRSVTTKEFDASRIPVMALLVERGADVNQKGESRVVVHHPIMYAAMAGAVERVRWLVDQGADPEAKGAWGSAAEYVAMIGSDEMRSIVQRGIERKQRSRISRQSFAIRPKSVVR